MSAEDFKEKIRDRMGAVSYIYRGNELPDLVKEIETRTVSGGTQQVWTSPEPVINEGEVAGEEVSSLPFFEAVKVPITGGFSDSLAQTHRFNGSNNTSLVLDPSNLPVSPVEYTYEYYNQNPGVYPHVRSSVASELRHQTVGFRGPEVGKLIGYTDSGPRSARDTTIVETVDRVELTNGANLPGTSANSLIAEEKEWVAQANSVNISNAIEGVVTIKEELGVRSAFTAGKDMIPKDSPPAREVVESVYESLNNRIPNEIDHYLIVVDSIGDAADRDPQAYPERVIDTAVGPRGRKIPPSEVPPRFRGVNR